MTGNSIIFGVGYLIKYPGYDCKVGVQWTACEREHICEIGLAKQDWRFNYQGEGSFINWIERMDLTCTDKAIVAMPGSVYFAGFCVSAAILPRLSDVYGRHLPFFLCILVQTIAYWFILHVQDIYQMAAAYLVVGLCAGGRVSIGCQYLTEFVPSNYGSIVISIWNAGDAVIMIY